MVLFLSYENKFQLDLYIDVAKIYGTNNPRRKYHCVKKTTFQGLNA